MKWQSQDPALQDRRSQPLGPAGLGRFHLGLPVSEARVRMETRKVEDALFKVGPGSCSPGFLPGLQAREGSVYVEVAPGNSCVSGCGWVCVCAQLPTGRHGRTILSQANPVLVTHSLLIFM